MGGDQVYSDTDTEADQPKCCLAGNPRQMPSKVSAAAASSAEEVTTDLKQLFKDALQSDVRNSAATPSASEGLDTSRIPAPSNPDRGKQWQRSYVTVQGHAVPCLLHIAYISKCSGVQSVDLPQRLLTVAMILLPPLHICSDRPLSVPYLYQHLHGAKLHHQVAAVQYYPATL